MSSTKRPIDDLFLTTTPIKFPGQEDDWGTGFFYRNGSSDYLVTNRHVLEGEDELVIRLRNKPDPKDTRTHGIDISERPPLTHPDNEIDVALLSLNVDLEDTHHETFTSNNFPDANIVVDIDAPLMVGYPIIESDAFFPVIRNATISTPFGYEHRGGAYFLMDATTHDGTSGSPVLYVTRQVHNYDKTRYLGDRRTFLLGINRGEHDRAQEGSEDLNRVIYAELIEEIL